MNEKFFCLYSPSLNNKNFNGTKYSTNDTKI